ncbi:Putative Holin-X, holin superfamily III [Salegentibacter holothuriorum]|uniref:Putative Holin-X, holin superfamily III n=1 Tax=Salegentibacter holothuriorum TaxID=241145 RepID=A0A1T5BVP8_9FLAO|nr:phage holin family protein [Salegentibacter holothuriorum]SKB51194.1 Putative Holin-X, holin superfamily III [Salegentibacter holothuriorum]
MAFEKLANSIEELNYNLKAFAHSNSEYYKLQFFKQAMKGATGLVYGLLLGIFFIFAIILISVALAIVISEAIGSPSSGYFIVGGFYFLVFLLILIFGKKPIEKFLLVKVSRKFFND